MTTATRMTTISPGEALDEYGRWRLDQAGFSRKTWAGEKPGLLAFVDHLVSMGATEMLAVNRLHVEAWWGELGVSDSTKPTRLSQLRSFLRYCIERGWLSYDPSALLRAPRPPREVRDRLDAGELLAATEGADEPRDRILLALAANLALRGGEICRLLVRDVNLPAMEITVRIDKTREIDVMPISADLAVELRQWLAHYFRTTAEHGLHTGSFLVPSRYVQPGNGHVFYRHQRAVAQPEDVVQQALTKLGWDDVKGEGVHTVRRSVARLYFDMIEAEESFDSALLATMTLLHHTRPETTIGYIGRDRLTLARDRQLRGRPFLTRLAEAQRLRVVQ